MEVIKDFLNSFVPLFVAIDAVGMVGVYLGLTEGQTATVKKRQVNEAVITATGIAIVFLAFGKAIFKVLGIEDNDFRIAGGLVLLILAIYDLLFSQEKRRGGEETSVGVVPLGIPLIMGPAALTTILLSIENAGFAITVASLIANMVIVWIVFRYADVLAKFMGPAGSRAVAKVMALFLAAIAVMMIRVGIEGFLAVAS